MIVGQDWGGPQGVGAALQRIERLAALVLMNTWLFTGLISKFHASPKPWTTWHAPLIGQFFMKRHKVLSQHGPSATTARGMSDDGSARLSSRVRRAGFGSRRADLAAHHSDAGRRSRLAGHASNRAAAAGAGGHSDAAAVGARRRSLSDRIRRTG